MPTIARSSRPTCSTCGFAVFNRRCATCERCGAVLPTSVVYTEAEMATMRQREQVEEDARGHRSATTQEEPTRNGSGTEVRTSADAGDGIVLDVVGLVIDLASLGDW